MCKPRRFVLGTAVTAILAGLALTGCTTEIASHDPSTLPPGDTSGGAGSSSASTQPSHTSGGHTGSTQPSHTSGGHKRHRPGALTRVITSTPADGGCSVTVAVGSADAAFDIERLGSQTVCFSPVGDGDTSQVEITSPSGAKLTAATMPGDPGERRWRVEAPFVDGPAGELGTYEFRIATPVATHRDPRETLPLAPSAQSQAASGSASVTAALLKQPPRPFIVTTGHFTVIPATRPAIAADSDGIRPGDELTVRLTGFPPRSSLYLPIFGPAEEADGTYPFRAEFPDLRADAHGEATARWHVPSQTAPGDYGIWIENGPGACHSFTTGCLPFRIIS